MSPPLLLLLLAALLAGCGTASDPARSLAGVRTLTLASVVGLSGADLPSGLSTELESSLRRSLSVRGYQVQDAEGGDAAVRASWFQERRVSAAGRPEVLLGISVSFFDRGGQRIFSARSARPNPATQWNGDRVAAEVAHLLRSLPEARAP